jgi:phosphoglycolate phosphatase
MRDLTLVFDLDGTLVDTAPDLILSTNEALASLGLAPVADRVVRPWISFGARRMITEALLAAEHHASEREVDAALDRFLAYYADNIALRSRPFPGTEAALDRFAAAGARLAVCTNKRESLTLKLLDQLRLTARFAAIAGRDTFPVSKPHPDHLLGAIRMAGGEASRAIMVGDSEVDIATAKAARVPVIAVTFGYTQIPVADLAPEAIISHYDEIDEAVRRLGTP